MILQADDARILAAFEHNRVLNHELAQLIAFAMHEPKKMPSYKPINSKKTPKATQADEDRVRAFFIGLASQRG